MTDRKTRRAQPGCRVAASVEINDSVEMRKQADLPTVWDPGRRVGCAQRSETEDRTSPLDTQSSLEHPATAQSQLVTELGE